MLEPVNRRSITPDWLPVGWTLEIKTQTDGANVGQQIKCYYDPSSRSRFYSKKEVFQHLEGLPVNEHAAGNQFCSTNQREDSTIDLNTNPCSTIGEKNINDDGLTTASTSQIESTNASLKTNPFQVLVDHAPDGLPPGWITETRFRKSKSIIKKDMLYIDLVGGYQFRSRKNALSYIAAGDISKCGFRAIKIEGKFTSKSEPHPQTSTTSLCEPGNGVQVCLSSEERPSTKVCGEIKSLAKGQLSAQEKITANAELLRLEDVNLSAKKTKVDRGSQVQPQAKKHKRDQKLGVKQRKSTNAITMPVQTSKRLAALQNDDLTESGVDDAISTPDTQLNPSSFRNVDQRSKHPTSNVHHSHVMPSNRSLEEALDTISVGSESKLLQSVNNDLAAVKSDLVEEMKLEVTTNWQSQPAKSRRHRPISKSKKLVKATTMPVRASKRLAALRYDTPEKWEVDNSGYNISIPNNQLETKSNKCIEYIVEDGINVAKVSDRKPERPLANDSAVLEIEHIQPQNDDLSVDKVKLIEEANKAKLLEQPTLALKPDEQPQSKKLKIEGLEGSKKNISVEKVAMPVQSSKQSTNLQVLCDDKLTHNNHMEEYRSSDIQAKYSIANEMSKETSKFPFPKAADRFKGQSKSSASAVMFEESSEAPVITENCEESSKFPLPAESFKETNIEFVSTLERQEDLERKKLHGKEISQDHVGAGKQFHFLSLFEDYWSDPCIEFAFKTLTGDIPKDFLQQQQQPGTSTGPTYCPAPSPVNHSHFEPSTDHIWSFGGNYMHSTNKNG